MSSGSGIRTGWILTSGIVGAILFVSAIAWLNSFFAVSRNQEVYRKVLSLSNPKLVELRAQEAEILNSLRMGGSAEGDRAHPRRQGHGDPGPGSPRGPKRAAGGMMRYSRFVFAAVILSLVLGQAVVTAQNAPDQVPAELEGIDLIDRSGETVPADIALVDEAGTAGAARRRSSTTNGRS